MAGQLYDVLRESRCPLCLTEFEDGTVVSFHGPCWIHPMCGNCRDEWRETQLDLGVYPTCPHCQKEYSVFDWINIKLEPWNEREEVDYPPQPDGHVGVEDLAGHQAPCCGKGYKAGDYVIASPCGHQVHFMHAWCFLVNRIRVDGDSLHYGDPFDCFTCGGVYAPTNAMACREIKDGVANEAEENEENENGSDGDGEQQEYYEDEANVEEDEASDEEDEEYYENETGEDEDEDEDGEGSGDD